VCTRTVETPAFNSQHSLKSTGKAFIRESATLSLKRKSPHKNLYAPSSPYISIYLTFLLSSSITRGNPFVIIWLDNEVKFTFFVRAIDVFFKFVIPAVLLTVLF